MLVSIHELAKLKYMLKPAGDIKMNGNAVTAANKNKQPAAKKIIIQR